MQLRFRSVSLTGAFPVPRAQDLRGSLEKPAPSKLSYRPSLPVRSRRCSECKAGPEGHPVSLRAQEVEQPRGHPLAVRAGHLLGWVTEGGGG